MISSFKNNATRKIFNQQFANHIPQKVQRRALRKLIMMEAATLRNSPANHLEKLSDDHAGQYSLKINDQYRICFKIDDQGNWSDVEIVDYHH